MAYADIASLAAAYPAYDRSEMLALANGYRRRNEREILELAAIASDIGLGDVTTFGLEPDANPQLLEAFKLQYKNVDPESLVGRSEEELQGFISGVKGKYFEVLIKDRLNSGETLGELRLEPGQVARLADLPNQQGWDLEIVDHQGDPVDLIQAKATVSIAPVREALRENPDIQVAVPDNLDNASPDVLGTDISWDDLSAEAEAHIGEMSEGAMANALQSTAELGIDVIPVGSVLLIGVVEGRRYLMGEATLRESMRTGAGRLPRAMAYSGIGTALARIHRKDAAMSDREGMGGKSK